MKKPTLESVAKVLVINEKNEALILTVGEYKERPDKSFKPDLPGGLVDPGETELIAVVRELSEETGITISTDQANLVYAKTEFFAKESKSVSKFLYLACLSKTPKVTISWEHSEYSWVPLSSLLSSVELRPFYDEAIRYCFSNALI
jgi:8-oxo-dGTP diphosphatase